MSLDTYLPVGRGRYLIRSEPHTPGSLYYFMPDSRDHVRVGFEVVRQDHYGTAGYSDVVVNTPGDKPVPVEEGEYSVAAPGRDFRVLELRSESGVKKILAFGQPGLGRFRFLVADDAG
ncbi:MAG: hypothetical protein A4E28_02563 [Methanocella sp. PtaU1.Bin125]|nr:MAG: hypothetical protein A4E28_02563 [Methanocella sp. PtaU1.Bin125]